MLKIISDAYSNGLFTAVIPQMPGGIATAVMIAGIVLCALIGYVLGSLNFSLIVSKKMYNDDVREHGSKNAGTTNMMRTYGAKAAGITILGDILKAIVAVVLCSFLMGVMHGGYASAVGAVLGHVFPVFYKFRGGKGVATAAAAILVLNPIAFAIVIGVFLLTVIFTRFISLGSVLAAAVFPLLTYYTYFSGTSAFPGSGFAFICSLIIALTVILKHHENLSRLAHGNETKFKFKKSKKVGKNDENDKNNE
ncbi:MAG: glycerol-3-phosphate 1-O-acyltransferase PlsY [Clostridia bacterium]|nr:glycerol-3-phosphate 1-O-acyltransferase PlsY [Clostridia bacterium]MBR4979124.1 glycerol-3-phosphate 1-O-acyltransferase PlsY [Clostridia bacterium]